MSQGNTSKGQLQWEQGEENEDALVPRKEAVSRTRQELSGAPVLSGLLTSVA